MSRPSGEKRSLFLERLLALKGDSNVSEFARFLGINQKTLDHAIKGERKPSVEMVASICSKTNVTSDWLIGLSDCPSGVTSDSDLLKRCQKAEKDLARVNKALSFILKGTNELQAIVEENGVK